MVIRIVRVSSSLHLFLALALFGFFLTASVSADYSEVPHLAQIGQMHVPVPGSPEDIAYSEFMHRLSGVFVLVLGALAVVEGRLTGKTGWIRWGWPVLFFLAGGYLMVRSDLDGWPVGPKGFIGSLQDPTILQHKVAASILLLLGLSEVLLRSRWRHPLFEWVFPGLAVSAGLILFFHGGHQVPKIHRQHLVMAWTALAIGVTRAASTKLKSAGALWPLLIVLLGVELVFYSE